MRIMAFEQLYQTTNQMVDLYLQYERKEQETEDPQRIRTARDRQFAILECMLIYYETTLKHAKFVSQRNYFKKKLEEINKPFFEGYFKKNGN
jgi:hypothetical protein